MPVHKAEVLCPSSVCASCLLPSAYSRENLLDLQNLLCPYPVAFWGTWNFPDNSTLFVLPSVRQPRIGYHFGFSVSKRRQPEGTSDKKTNEASREASHSHPLIQFWYFLLVVCSAKTSWNSEPVFSGSVRLGHFPLSLPLSSSGLWWRVSSVLPNSTFSSYIWLVSYRELIYPDCQLFNTRPSCQQILSAFTY